MKIARIPLFFCLPASLTRLIWAKIDQSPKQSLNMSAKKEKASASMHFAAICRERAPERVCKRAKGSENIREKQAARESETERVCQRDTDSTFA